MQNYLEIGAGYGQFGKYFSETCYLTDSDTQLIRKNLPLDFICEAYKLPCPDKQIDVVIICNPYNYGFTKDNIFLNELLRTLKNNSSIIIIGHSTNKFCRRDVIENTINFYNETKKMQLNLKYEKIDSKLTYPDHTFFTVDKRKTFPNFKIEISVKQ